VVPRAPTWRAKVQFDKISLSNRICVPHLGGASVEGAPEKGGAGIHSAHLMCGSQNRLRVRRNRLQPAAGKHARGVKA
jgi:hypothetical protein